jgi:hypothetical protein
MKDEAHLCLYKDAQRANGKHMSKNALPKACAGSTLLH